jgi:FtsP/CotA-like multicopper oxidase with cupredoxin domain
MKRRQFITLSASTVGAVFLSRCAFGQSQAQLVAPESYASKDGLLDISLGANYGPASLADQQANLLNYNGRVPGPLLEARPGDTVRIRFTNNLPQPTNLHYHGLHISPTGTADNVFLKVPSGETFNYEFAIPKNHPAGTFWYHPHLHGLVAEQVSGGLAGLLVVRGELDELPEVAAAKEQFLVLQDFELTRGGDLVTPNPMERMTGREGSLVTVNGGVNPSLSVRAGGLLRLRLLNASVSRFYRLSLEEHPFYLIATDGGAVERPVELKEILLTPGERVEVLVRGDREPGQYRLLNLPYDRGGMMMGGGMMGGGMMGGRTGRGSSSGVLATLTYSDRASTPLPLPEKLLSVEQLPEPKRVRSFLLNHGMAPGMGMVFLINGRMFDHDRVDTSVQLNEVEDWELTNNGVMDHPFHLHLDPFQVISRTGILPVTPERAWKDTILVKTGETVRVRVPFRDFAGKTVYHCHILDHEDLGMMGNLEIKS